MGLWGGGRYVHDFGAEDLGLEGRAVLKRILNKYSGLRERDLCGSVKR